MKSQEKIDIMFMDIAIRISEESYCERKQVGCILTKDNERIISIGYNGTPPGEDNCCEEIVFGGIDNTGTRTKANVRHAERNAYRKLLRSTESSLESTLYCTLLPCEECADLIIESGTTRVVYLEKYRCDKGLQKLLEKNVKVDEYGKKDNEISKALIDICNTDNQKQTLDVIIPTLFPENITQYCSSCGKIYDDNCQMSFCPNQQPKY